MHASLGTPVRLACLSKDGTLLRNPADSTDPARMELASGAEIALPLLRRAGFRLVIVSSQPAAPLRSFDESALTRVARRLDELCSAVGVRLSGFYACPHPRRVDGAPTCECREPDPGLVRRALVEHGARAEASWLIGDILDLVEAGHRAGCRSALVDNGHETEWRWTRLRTPDARAGSLAAVAQAITMPGLATAEAFPVAWT